MDDAKMRQTAPPQPSSAVTTLRALVMLAGLVGIPIIALRGTAFSEMIRAYVIDRLGGTPSAVAARADLDEAPLFAPQASSPTEPQLGFAPSELGPLAASSSQAASYQATDARDANQPLGGQAQWAQGQSQFIPPRGQTVASAHEGPPGQFGPGGEAVLANYDSAPSPWVEPGTAISPKAQETPAPSRVAGGQIEQVPYVGQTGTGLPSQIPDRVGQRGTIDQFLYIQQRLRDLGANYYLLESWGDEGECYRFHCRIAVASSANFTKHFEATDQQPLGAMTRVLADVESWRRGSPTGEPLSAGPVETGQLPGTAAGQQASPYGTFVR